MMNNLRLIEYKLGTLFGDERFKENTERYLELYHRSSWNKVLDTLIWTAMRQWRPMLQQTYANFIGRFHDVLGKHADEYIEYGMSDIQDQLNHLFLGNELMNQHSKVAEREGKDLSKKKPKVGTNEVSGSEDTVVVDTFHDYSGDGGTSSSPVETEKSSSPGSEPVERKVVSYRDICLGEEVQGRMLRGRTHMTLKILTMKNHLMRTLLWRIHPAQLMIRMGRKFFQSAQL
ncbi:Cullin repeat-like-containing domain superfamily [Sesbania bispinosa]|nr:Cullin repeat-like-containing domain superfamily [Sesbania bispinosa]